jgi:Caspase domain
MGRRPANLRHMNRRAFIAALAASSASSAIAQTSPAQAAPLVYYAGQAGRLTSDRSSQGGNPFASALCEVIGERPLTLEKFTRRMAEANQIHSRGWQMLDYPRVLPDPKRRLDKGEGRVALVLVNADYSKSNAYSLPGAAHDAKRVPEALITAGFQTTLVLDANAEEARAALAEFALASEAADSAIIYIGGHGAQHQRIVYWIMGDFPEQDAKWLPTHAVPVSEIAKAGRARSLNLVLYASCRDDPFT